MSVLTLLSFFLIIAIGTDDCFVYWDTWKYSAMLDLRPLEDPSAMNALKGNLVLGEESDETKEVITSLRLAWTLKTAGSAMLVTTFTSAAAFFAICLSLITPVRNFGVFMGLHSFTLTNLWHFYTFLFFLYLIDSCEEDEG